MVIDDLTDIVEVFVEKNFIGSAVNKAVKALIKTKTSINDLLEAEKARRTALAKGHGVAFYLTAIYDSAKNLIYDKERLKEKCNPTSIYED